MSNDDSPISVSAHKQAQFAFFGFILTFILARSFVFLIMSHQMPNLYCFVQGTHVHHLNYGIFLMAVAGGYGIFRRPQGRAGEITALIYGVALGLTFDEFGMWLHLGGSYWQRASVDVVIVIAAILGLCGFIPDFRRFESRHLWGSIILAVALVVFGLVLYTAGSHLAELVGPRLHELEASSSP